MLRPRRLRLVTVTAWAFLLLALPALLDGALTISCSVVLKGSPLCEVPGIPSEVSDALSPGWSFYFKHEDAISAALFSISLIQIPICIGLLRRLEWARRSFRWILLANAVETLAFSLAFSNWAAFPDTTFFLAVGFTVVCAWLAWRLEDPSIRVQFR